jgi:aryl-alcohol dehydrogenase-like predicted oxidoreductase
MHYRPLGRTGLQVSEIGYGAWGIGGSMWIGAQEDESVRALHRAIELGVNVIDTARGYGESERIVGQVVRAHGGQELYVATKVPPKNGTFPAPDGLDPSETFPGAHIRESVQTSLTASGLEAFDVLQLHVWSDEWVGRGDWLETIDALKQEGTIRLLRRLDQRLPAGERAGAHPHRRRRHRPGDLQRLPPAARGAAAPRLPGARGRRHRARRPGRGRPHRTRHR